MAIKSKFKKRSNKLDSLNQTPPKNSTKTFEIKELTIFKKVKFSNNAKSNSNNHPNKEKCNFKYKCSNQIKEPRGSK